LTDINVWALKGKRQNILAKKTGWVKEVFISNLALKLLRYPEQGVSPEPTS